MHTKWWWISVWFCLFSLHSHRIPSFVIDIACRQILASFETWEFQFHLVSMTIWTELTVRSTYSKHATPVYGCVLFIYLCTQHNATIIFGTYLHTRWLFENIKSSHGISALISEQWIAASSSIKCLGHRYIVWMTIIQSTIIWYQIISISFNTNRHRF